MEEKWSNQAWKSTQEIYNRTIIHPFLQELMQGVLSKDRFEHYIQQDALYLGDYGKCLMGISKKLSNPTYKTLFQKFADDSILCEQALHEVFMKQLCMKQKKTKSGSCLRYTSFLCSCVDSKSLGEALAAVLPCFWVYNEVGKYLCAHQTQNSNPYQAWIDMYAGDAFDEDVKKYLAIINEYADAHPDEQSAMTIAFATAVQAEYDFWDSAYQLEMN